MRRLLAGSASAHDGKPRGETGPDGRINIRARHGGFQLVQASLHRVDPPGKADEIIHATSLNFELCEK